MKIELENKYVGQIGLWSGKVDVTDPCYDKDSWCRTVFEVTPGEYSCFAGVGEYKDTGKRVWIATILHADEVFDWPSDLKDSDWEYVDSIGVDAGLAGFFEDKPDFNDDEWQELCNWMQDKTNSKVEGADAYIKHFATGDGFWTESGFGDGEYEVYAVKRDDKIIALEIRF